MRGFALTLLFLLGGCFGYVKPTENQRQLNAQNEDAGKQIAEKAVQPEIKQAGQDVAANSKVLKDTLIGEPEVKKAYSPEASAQIRTITIKEYDESKAPWYKRWAGTLLTGLGTLLTVGAFAARFFPATAPIMAVAQPIVGALMAIKQKADAHETDSLPLDDIQSEISKLANDPKVGLLVSSLLAKLHLSQAIHAPEAPDPSV